MLRATCLVNRSDADQAHADADRAHADALLAREDSAAVVSAINSLAAAEPPATTAVAFSETDTARFEATRYGVWFLAGLGCVGLLMPAIRKYWP